MTTRTLNDLFEPESTDAQLHPRLRRWQKLVADGFCFTLEIYRKWDGLTYAPTRMFVHIRKGDGDPGTLDEILWEEELNQGLIRLGVAAVDINQESMRYALSFRYAFGAVSSRHGQDFFRAVLVAYLRASPLADQPKLKRVLELTHVYKTTQERGDEQAVEAIDNIVKTKAQELTHTLKYEREAAVTVVSDALAQYLDEIFHLKTMNLWLSK